VCGKARIGEDYWGQSEPPLLHFYPAPTVYSLLDRSHLPSRMLKPALPRCASHKHVFECLSMHLQSGALARSEWDVPTAEPPLLHFYTAATAYSCSRLHCHAVQAISTNLIAFRCTYKAFTISTQSPPYIFSCSRLHCHAVQATSMLLNAFRCTNRAAPSPGPNGTSLLLSLPWLVFTPAIIDVSCLSTHTCLDACSCHAVHAPSTFLNALQHTIPSGALIRSEWDVPAVQPPLHSVNTHRSPHRSPEDASPPSPERRPHPVRMGRPCC